MQKSLDANRLLALVEDGIEAGTLYVSSAKRDFREQNLSEGMRNLLMAFGMFLPYLRIHKYTCENVQQGPEDWSIAFGNRPFTHLSIRPDTDRSAFINVYEDDKHSQTYEMLGRPDQWQAFMKWLWNYGNDRLIRQAAIQARRKASRKQSKPQVPSDVSRSNSSRKDPTRKHPPDSALHRALGHKSFKAQASKRKGKIIPSKLGMASLSLSDIEGGARRNQTLQEKDLNERMAGDYSTHGIAGPKNTSGDAYMSGAE